jgi:hypothetical protein
MLLSKIHPTPNRKEPSSFGSHLNHLNWRERASPGVLAAIAKNLAKTLDKGLAVEYVARVLIVSQFDQRASQTRTCS